MAVDVGAVVSLVILGILILGPLAWAARHYAVAQDLRTAATVLRIDTRALSIGVLLLAGAAAAHVLLWQPAAPITTMFAGTLLVFGTAGLTVAAANIDWYRWAQRLPDTEPSAATPGPILLSGRVVPTGDLVPASVTKTDAVAYRASTREEHAVLGRGYAGSTWSAVSVAQDAVPFGLVDEPEILEQEDETDAGPGRTLPAHLRAELDDAAEELGDVTASVRVDGPAASYPLLFPTSRLVHASPAAVALEGLERIVPAEPGTTVPVRDELARGTRPRPREYSERRIDPGDPVTVLGTAREDADGLTIVDDPDGPPLLVLRTDAETARKHVRRFCRTYGLLGLLCYAGGLALLASVGL